MIARRAAQARASPADVGDHRLAQPATHIVAILLAVTKIGPRPGQGPAFLSAVLSQGSLFSVAALAIVLPLFLPVAVAVISGDSIAGEAQSGMLRYLLARPVGRTRLLVAKLVAVFVFVIVAVVIVAGVGYLVGSLLLGQRAGDGHDIDQQRLRNDADRQARSRSHCAHRSAMSRCR